MKEPSIGVSAEAIVRHLLTNRRHPEIGYRACLGLLSLSRNYGKERLEAACQRALVIGAPTQRSVRTILQTGYTHPNNQTWPVSQRRHCAG